MKKSWTVPLTIALAACSGGSINTPSAPARAELHVAPSFVAVAATKADPIDASLAFVRQQGVALGLDGHAGFTALRHEITADGFDHVRLQETYDGIKVWGSDIVVHNDGTNITAVDGRLLGSVTNLDLVPSVADTTAMTFAKNDYVGKEGAGVAPRTAAESSELVIFPLEDGSAHLAWHVVFNVLGAAGGVRGMWNYFVDAHDGSVLLRFNNLQTAAVEASGPGGNARITRTWNMNLDVSQSGTTYTMNTTQFETQNNKTSQDFSGTSLNPLTTDQAANDAHGFAEITIKMLKDWQGYNSIDNKGFKILSLVHVPDPNTGQYNFDNAFWDGQQMNYGDGDGTTFFEFTGALDVIAHEMDHGFTSFHSNLAYTGQSGGMNESFSDIAGTTAKFYYDAKSADFNLGGDIFKQAGQYIRWMCKPSMDGMSIDTASQYKNGLDVHYSSGVMNRAFCRAAKRLSGADPDTGTATVDGVKKASKAWYEANASHWTMSTQWTAGCQGVVDAATALTYMPAEISALGDSWKDVGVTCNYTHVDDFGMTLTPATATVMAGMPATFTVATTVGAGNMAQSVTLSATGLPSGVTATFSPPTMMSGSSSTLTIQTAYDTPLGDIKFSAKATGAATHTADATLTVTAPPPDMTQLPPDMGDDGNGGNGGSGGGNGNHGGDSGCSFAGGGAASSSAGALFFVLVAAALLFRRRAD